MSTIQPKKNKFPRLIMKILLALATAMGMTFGISEVTENTIENKQPKEDTMGLKPQDVLPVVGGLVDTVIGGAFNSLSGRRNRKFAREMYWTERNNALADWNMQNEYNSPSAQMERLKEAGLNPFLVYGNGGSAIQAATVRGGQGGTVQETPMQGTRLGESMREIYNIKLADAQLKNQSLVAENLRQDLANKKANEFSTYAEAANKVLNSKHLKFDLDRKNELTMQIIEDAWAKTGLTKAQIDATVHGNKRAEELHPYNIQMAGKLNTEKDIEITGKKIDNLMKQMQNQQFDAMRPLELARVRAQLAQIGAQIQNTLMETKNTVQIERLNKMDADVGKVFRYLKDVMGMIPVGGPAKGGRR